MSIKVNNWVNDNRKVIAQGGMFKVIEHQRDLSVGKSNAVNAYFESLMNVRLRQVEATLDGTNMLKTQAGAMQMMVGNVEMNSGMKGGAKGFIGAMVKSAATNETISKPEYTGVGQVILEPTYKHIILQNVADWASTGGLVVEDGMFLASEGTVTHNVVEISKNLGTALFSGEGFYNLCFTGSGVVALESYVPFSELVEYELVNDVLKVDGNMAVCWSGSLEFSLEKATKSLLGSMVSGEGLVNVYRGTGKVWVSPVAGTRDGEPKKMSTSNNNSKEAGGAGLLGSLFG